MRKAGGGEGGGMVAGLELKLRAGPGLELRVGLRTGPELELGPGRRIGRRGS